MNNPDIKNILNTLVQVNGVVIVGNDHLFLPEQATSIPLPTSSTWMFFRNMTGPQNSAIDTATIFARLQGR